MASQEKSKPNMTSGIDHVTSHVTTASNKMAFDIDVRNGQNRVNPDLQRERDSASFNVEELTLFLHGGPEKLKRKNELEHLIFSDPLFQDADRMFRSRAEIYDLSVHKSVKMFEWKRKFQWTEEDFDMATVLASHDLALALHHTMFIPAIERLGTNEQKAKWLPLALNFKLIGTYAQTELGHGTNLSALETKAEFDPTTDEFVLNTPQITSIKWWPGGLGKSCTHAIVLAQLYIQDKTYGLHPFMVQLRSLENHMPLPGITVGDIGPKLGLLNVDNGFLVLKNVRIPRINMLMRNSQVARNGQFTSSGSNKANYATMMLVRAKILSWSCDSLKQGVTCSVRYSAVRRQSQLKPGGEEMQILSYQSQQYKLFPALACAYTQHFVATNMLAFYEKTYADIMAGNNQLLAELHSQLSCLKALLSDQTLELLETLRRCMGGHGYMSAAGVGDNLLGSLSLATVEGENTVMYQQAARYLMKQVANSLSGEPLPPSVSYLGSDPPYTCTLRTQEHCRTPRLLLEVYRKRTYRVVTMTAHRLHADMKNGQEQHDAWNNNMIRLVEAAKCHGEYFMLECFVKGVESASLSPETTNVLNKLCTLYALWGVARSSGSFLETDSLSASQVQLMRDVEYKLLAEIRPEAVALVDSFAQHDIMLHSALGCYDGNVYERLYDTALRNPMNATEVDPSYYKYLRTLIKGHKASKL